MNVTRFPALRRAIPQALACALLFSQAPLVSAAWNTNLLVNPGADATAERARALGLDRKTLYRKLLQYQEGEKPDKER